MSVEIRTTDFTADRRLVEEAEREMSIDSGTVRRSKEEGLFQLVRDSLNNNRNKLERAQGASFCAFDEGRSIGYVFANVDGLQRTGFITAIYVVQKFRDQGIGRQLTEHLLDYLLGHGINDIGLVVTATNDRARHLYESFGFEIKRHVMRRITRP